MISLMGPRTLLAMVAVLLGLMLTQQAVGHGLDDGAGQAVAAALSAPGAADAADGCGDVPAAPGGCHAVCGVAMLRQDTVCVRPAVAGRTVAPFARRLVGRAGPPEPPPPRPLFPV